MRRVAFGTEALIALIAASLLIRLVPFRQLASARRAPQLPPAPPALAATVARRIDTIADRLPWRALCFERGLAARLMLHRRRCRATLFYGVRHDEAGELVAHVWVRSGECEVIGCAESERFAVLVTLQ